jgi:serine/threonine-protein kinase OSR1/STK39
MQRSRSRDMMTFVDAPRAFPLAPSQYKLLHLIGHGQSTQAEVWAARCLLNDKTVAVRLTDLDLDTPDIDHLRQEMAFWSTCQHQNVMQYHTSFLAGSILWCVMEYMDGGSVADLLRWHYPNGITDESIIATILQGLLTFLVYFHTRKQLHRAICPGSIFLTALGHVKVGKLGSVTEMIRAGRHSRACFTTIESAYSAPEAMVEGSGCTESSDIWSVGITALAMATGQAPFAAMTQLEQMKAIISGPAPDLPATGYSSQFRSFMRHCLQRDPERRPTAANLLKHAFLRKAKGPEFLAAVVMAARPLVPHAVQRSRASAPARLTTVSFNFDFESNDSPQNSTMITASASIEDTERKEEHFHRSVHDAESEVNDLSSEARRLEDKAMQIAELLRATQESINQLTQKKLYVM